MSPDLVRIVWERAGAHCEYCHLAAGVDPRPFQIDHVIAKQHGGSTEIDNLALACIRCNRFKGPNIAGVDPDSGEVVRLFHPRRDPWTDHFAWEDVAIRPVTPIGWVTIALLRLNDPEVIALREALRDERGFPVGSERDARQS